MILKLIVICNNHLVKCTVGNIPYIAGMLGGANTWQVGKSKVSGKKLVKRIDSTVGGNKNY